MLFWLAHTGAGIWKTAFSTSFLGQERGISINSMKSTGIMKLEFSAPNANNLVDVYSQPYARARLQEWTEYTWIKGIRSREI